MRVKVINKEELKTEITKAIDKYGSGVDLNYIDTSQTTDMSRLFTNSGFKLDMELLLQVNKWVEYDKS
jgi:hypothetical protein